VGLHHHARAKLAQATEQPLITGGAQQGLDGGFATAYQIRAAGLPQFLLWVTIPEGSTAGEVGLCGRVLYRQISPSHFPVKSVPHNFFITSSTVRDTLTSQGSAAGQSAPDREENTTC
jgi:hypothetical protein